MPPQNLADDGDESGRGNHPGFDGVGVDVGKHPLQLLFQKFRGRFHNAVNAGGILGRQGGDGAHGVNAIGRHGLDIGLDPRRLRWNRFQRSSMLFSCSFSFLH